MWLSFLGTFANEEEHCKIKKNYWNFELSLEEENRTIVNTQNLELLSLYEHFHGEKLLSFSKVGGVVIYAV